MTEVPTWWIYVAPSAAVFSSLAAIASFVYARAAYHRGGARVEVQLLRSKIWRQVDEDIPLPLRIINSGLSAVTVTRVGFRYGRRGRAFFLENSDMYAGASIPVRLEQNSDCKVIYSFARNMDRRGREAKCSPLPMEEYFYADKEEERLTTKRLRPPIFGIRLFVFLSNGMEVYSKAQWRLLFNMWIAANMGGGVREPVWLQRRAVDDGQDQ